MEVVDTINYRHSKLYKKNFNGRFKCAQMTVGTALITTNTTITVLLLLLFVKIRHDIYFVKST